MKKRLLGLILALGMVVAIVPMALADGTTETTSNGITSVTGLKEALQAAASAASAADKTVTLTQDLTIESSDLTDVSKNSPIIQVPAGVTLDGGDHIISVASGVAGNYHIMGVVDTTSTTDVTAIRNVKIIGNETGLKAGINAYGSGVNLTLTNVHVNN